MVVIRFWGHFLKILIKLIFILSRYAGNCIRFEKSFTYTQFAIVWLLIKFDCVPLLIFLNWSCSSVCRDTLVLCDVISVLGISLQWWEEARWVPRCPRSSRWGALNPPWMLPLQRSILFKWQRNSGSQKGQKPPNETTTWCQYLGTEFG